MPQIRPLASSTGPPLLALYAARARAMLAALDAGAGAGAPKLSVPPNWSSGDAEATRAQLAAEWADVAAKLEKLASEASRKDAELRTARELVAKLDAMLPLAQERERDVAKLVAEGFMASHAGQDRRRERIELERDLATQRSRLAEAMAGLQESVAARSAFLAETRRLLREREAQADVKRGQFAQERTKAAAREQLTVLRAPASGTVQQLAVHTPGGVVTEAQTLMVIVPRDAEVTAEVAIENKDVGFVREGQEAVVKLETFPFTRYGTIPAQVVRLGADAVVDDKRGATFPATLKLTRNVIEVDGKKIRLSPGMNLSAEVKTGRRTIMEFLLAPVQQMRSESLRER